MISVGLYPSATSLTARLGRFPSWAEYMAEFGRSLYLPESQLIQDHTASLSRGLIKDTLPLTYDAGPIYENDEDGWIEVKARHRYSHSHSHRKQSKKATKKVVEQIQQQSFLAQTISFSGNAHLLEA